jgi:hypothetical protein
MTYILKFIIILLAVLTNHSCAYSTDTQSEMVGRPQLNSSIPFKIGFEFQEINNLCPWAKGNYSLEKMVIFSAKTSINNKLWDITIDGSDIEFVLPPFTHNQGDELNQAVTSVILACQHLTQLLTNKPRYLIGQTRAALEGMRESAQLERLVDAVGYTLYQNYNDQGFRLWVEWASADYIKTFYRNKKGLEVNLERVEEPLLNHWQTLLTPIKLDAIMRLSSLSPKPDPQSPEVSFADWYDSLVDSTEGESFSVANNDLWQEIKDKPFRKWVTGLTFQPQATIQYPLEYSLPLWLGLFGFEKNSFFDGLIDCLPKTGHNEDTNHYFRKEVGLVYLHALTLENIKAPFKGNSSLLGETLKYSYVGQVDAKRSLPFMARRPFSEMWEDVKACTPQTQTFEQLHQNLIMTGNKSYLATNDFSVPEMVRLLNYAEVHLTNKKDRPCDLTPLLMGNVHDTVFATNFYIEHEDVLRALLSQGILSTTMIRNFNPQKVEVQDTEGNPIPSETPDSIFQGYYPEMVRSVDTPNKHYKFCLNRKAIIKEPTEYDALSPPWFLDQTDSMGAFKKALHPIDLLFGEAIIEARMVKKLGSFFYDRYNIPLDNRGEFLIHPDKRLEGEVKSLFSFLLELKQISSSQQYKNVILQFVNR